MWADQNTATAFGGDPLADGSKSGLYTGRNLMGWRLPQLHTTTQPPSGLCNALLDFTE